jgi:hypothetical protein
MGHHQFSPSSFPAFDVCPHFTSSGEGNKNADYGTTQHSLLECLINENFDEFESIDADVNQRSNAEWSFGVVMNIIQKEKMKGKVTVIAERQLATETSDMTFITGTADVIILTEKDGKVENLIVIDAKFGKRRNYLGQLYVYALGAMQEWGLEKCEIVTLYGQLRAVEEDIAYKDVAVKYVDDVLDRVKYKHLEERKSSSYCEWCSNKKTCPAVLVPVKHVADMVPVETKDAIKGVDMSNGIMNMSSTHIGKLIDFIDLLEEVKELAKEELIKRMDDGEVIPGWKITERSGSTLIADQDGLMFELKAIHGVTNEQIVEESNLTVTAVKKILYGKEATKRTEEFKEQFGAFLKVGEASRSVTKSKETKTKKISK